MIEPSPLDMRVDGYDLSSGVIFNGLEPYTIDETYPWHGAHSVAVNRCNGVKVSLTHDLSQTPYILEIRAFNDGVAYRHVIAGAADAVRVPNEYSKFVLPAGTTVWYHDLDGHYEAEYDQQDISEVKAGQWAGPPVTFQLPGSAGYRLDHRSEPGQLRRHGARKRRPPGLDRGPRPPTTHQLSLRASLRPRGGQTSRRAGVGHRHDHHALARGPGRPRPERAGQQRHSAQPVSARRPEVLSAGDEDALGPAEPVRLGLRGPQLRAPGRRQPVRPHEGLLPHGRPDRGQVPHPRRLRLRLVRRADPGVRRVLQTTRRAGAVLAAQQSVADPRGAGGVLRASAPPGRGRGQDRLLRPRSQGEHRSLRRAAEEGGRVPVRDRLPRRQQADRPAADLAQCHAL